ncbi:MAG: HAD family phosphatase [Chloracidobacterium sp.]|nr:HAD family phosphatase [Chloracidobacterium sp.]MCO5333552.1 HAD family phosphatase [Pyrinomonadaceae bacterium]
MIKAILMDFNGVIINDESIQMKAYQEILKEYDIDLTEADYMASLGMDDKAFVRAAFERVGKAAPNGKADEIIDAKFAAWKAAVDREIPLFDGIENFIEKMAREFEIGIVSMSRRREIDHILDRSGLGRHFSAIVSAEMVEQCKPDPTCYREGFRLLDAARTFKGHSPMAHAECLAIEDTPPGITAARGAGLQALGVANTVAANELRSAGARAVAAGLNDWMPESIRLVFSARE